MSTATSHKMTADQVHPTLDKWILKDGFPFVLDMKKSQGSYLYDEVTGKKYVDFFTFFASNALGMNHPGLRNDEEFKERLLDAALNKVSNSDIYTTHMARFVDTFGRVGIPEHLPNAFFVSGGALAVENALKTAMDWKVRKNFEKGYREEKGTQIMHFEKAFHGRTGYTMSLTNTIPMKVAYFPKFDWPRVVSPFCNGRTDAEIEAVETLALNQMAQYFADRKDDIAAVILEPIQGEGGDNHFRPSFLQKMIDLVHENDALVIFDEVQTGVGLTGSFWAHEGLGVTPDIISFGKKTQVCGILAGPRVLEVKGNVFETASRINSTWGGNLVDMVRFDRILEIIEEDNLVANAATVGAHLLSRLEAAEAEFDFVTNARGQGMMCSFELADATLRNRVVSECYEKGLIILGCADRTMRFRPALTASTELIDEGMDILIAVLRSI